MHVYMYIMVYQCCAADLLEGFQCIEFPVLEVDELASLLSAAIAPPQD